MSSGLKSFMNHVLRKAFPFCAVFNIIQYDDLKFSTATGKKNCFKQNGL